MAVQETENYLEAYFSPLERISKFGRRLTLTDQARLSEGMATTPMAQPVDLMLHASIDPLTIPLGTGPHTGLRAVQASGQVRSPRAVEAVSPPWARESVLGCAWTHEATQTVTAMGALRAGGCFLLTPLRP